MKLEDFIKQKREQYEANPFRYSDGYVAPWNELKEMQARRLWYRTWPLRNVVEAGGFECDRFAKQWAKLECGHTAFGTPNAKRMRCQKCAEHPNAEVSDGGPLTHDKPAAQSRRSLH